MMHQTVSLATWRTKSCVRCGNSADGKAIYQFKAEEDPTTVRHVGTVEAEYYYCQDCLEWMHEHYTVDAIEGSLEFPD